MTKQDLYEQRISYLENTYGITEETDDEVDLFESGLKTLTWYRGEELAYETDVLIDYPENDFDDDILFDKLIEATNLVINYERSRNREKAE